LDLIRHLATETNKQNSSTSYARHGRSAVTEIGSLVGIAVQADQQMNVVHIRYNSGLKNSKNFPALDKSLLMH